MHLGVSTHGEKIGSWGPWMCSECGCFSWRRNANDVLFSDIETQYQWEFQDPKMEVLYHIRPYFGGISPYIGLT